MTTDGLAFRPSFAQQRLWFLHELNPDDVAYNIPAAVRLTGPLDRAALRLALDDLIARHETLRTSFALRDEVVQVVHEPFPIELPVTDLGSLAQPEREAEAMRLAAQEARRPFDLGTLPLLRAALLCLRDTDHLLVLVVHHVVADGWSMGVLAGELAARYEGHTRGQPMALTELPVQYADFAEWQRGRLSGPRLEQLLGYWKDRLAGAPAPLQLPTDNPRPAVQSFRGARHPILVEAPDAQALTALTRQQGATVFMAVLAAFNALLHRYTGQTDLVVGVPTAGRPQVQLESLIGCFVNTLPMRTDVSGDPSFRELLARVRDDALAAYAHDELPFELLVDELAPARDLARQPIFQTLLVLHNAPAARVEVGELTITPVELDVGTSKFDLVLSLEEHDGALRGHLEYNTDLFTRDTVERMGRHLGNLIQAATADPDQRLSSLALAGADEARELLSAGMGRDAARDTSSCLHGIFEAQAARTPDAVAVRCEDESVTYRQLDERAERLAARLRKLGVGPDVRVGLCLQRSLAVPVGLLAILKAGGAYVPLDPAYPRQRLGYMLRDSGTAVVVTDDETAHVLAGLGVRLVLVGSDDHGDDATVRRHDAPQPAPDNLAYVIYTSGSTGRPKGVLVTHANACRLFEGTATLLGLSESDVTSVFHSYAFDFSVWELWGALLFGGCAVVVPEPATRSPELLHDLLLREQVTVLSQTPSSFRQFARVALVRDAPLPLRLVVFGGEELDPRTLGAWIQRYGDQHPELVNMYGITEATVHVSYRRLLANDTEAAHGSVIGSPLPHMAMHVLDDRLQPVPVGVPGEIYVGGGGVARGYLGRPALTADQFVPDPFSTRPGRRLFRSGDLARRLPRGDVEYLGRRDAQVQVRGYRVEPGEIEATLGTHDDVLDAAVVARRDDGQDTSLVAYVVCRPEQELTTSELRRFLADRLPAHMLPAAYVTLPSLPLTPSGKLDRRALPPPDTARPALDSELVNPRTPVEEVLAEVWRDVLDLDAVGIHDNFFELGGDSMRSIQVRAGALERGLDFSLEQLFRYQTIAQLAAKLTTRSGSSSPLTQGVAPFSLLSDEDREGLPAGFDDAYPMTQLQSGMVFHSQFDPDSALFYDVESYHLHGKLDVPRLEEALRRVVGRHAMLRTSLDMARFSEPLQLVHQAAEARLEVIDVRDTPAEHQAAAIERWREAARQRRFDWQRPPLLRVTVHLRSDDTFQLTIIFHHAILDGWSLFLLLREWFDDYAALRSGAKPAFAAPPASTFRDYVALERAALGSDAQREFWLTRIAETEATRISRLGDPACATEASEIVNVDVQIPAEVSDGLKELARSTRIPLKSCLLAAHLRVLSVTSGQRDVVTGMVSHGRVEEPEGDRTIGLFLNTLPFTLRLDGGTWVDLARACFETEAEVLPHRRYPMAELRRLLGRPLYQAVFNFTNYHLVKGIDSWGDIEHLEGYSDQRTDCQFLAEFSLDPVSDHVKLHLSYHPEHIGGSAPVAEVRRYYERALCAMARQPLERYETRSLLAPSQRCAVLEEWNDTITDRPGAVTLHELFEAQVDRTPHATAVVCGEQQATYEALDRRAHQIARALRERGVGPERLVGVCLRRSIDLVASLLGILKAGGAYLPLDPEYPPERLRFMLEDASVALVVTESGLAERLPEGRQLVVLDGDGLPPAEPQHDRRIDGGARGGNLAYAIYTSGSSGVPKAVAIQHAGAVNLVTWAIGFFPRADFDRVLAATSVCFDCILFELFAPLSCGGRAVLVDSVVHLPDLGEHDQVHMVGIVPSALNQLLGLGRFPRSVRAVAVAGETMPASLVHALGNETSVERIYNLYGPAEFTTYATAGMVAPDTADPVPIGRPIANAAVYVLDPHLEPVPVGAPGEIYLAGDGLARGYVHRAALTAERFVPDPFAGRPGARMYRTGDLGAWLPDARLEFLGRADAQVKLRGYRIEPGEIEVVLAAHPGVRQAAVVLSEDTPVGAALVAYVVPRDAEPPQHRDLACFLGDRLPAHMVPASFVAVPELPQTCNAKLDRSALPAPATALRSDDEPTLASSRMEQAVAEIWASVLALEQIDVQANFFELGGTSLQALQIASKASDTLDVDVPVRLVFEHPTIAELAHALESAPPRQVRTPAPARPSQPVAHSTSLTIERRPLLALYSAGRLQPVDVAAVCTLPTPLVTNFGLSVEEVTQGVFDGLPSFGGIYEMSLGRIGLIHVPWFDFQLYSDPERLVESLIEALEIADLLRARMVTLTDLLASATDYGRALARAVEGRQLPSITTGHATTASTVVLTVQRLLAAAGRNIGEEHVGFLGMGAIGTAALRLILAVLPHPRALTLCDVYARQDTLEQMRAEAIDQLGFKGTVRVQDSRGQVPDPFYDATLMVGATNVPDVLDVDRLQPGTLIADDSGPHCFNAGAAVERSERAGDVLFTRAGQLRTAEAVRELRYLPPALEALIEPHQIGRDDPNTIEGCILSPLLSVRLDDVEPTLGVAELSTALRHYNALVAMGCEASRPECIGYRFSDGSLEAFQARFGHSRSNEQPRTRA